jgi:hypothetical protein
MAARGSTLIPMPRPVSNSVSRPNQRSIPKLDQPWHPGEFSDPMPASLRCNKQSSSSTNDKHASKVDCSCVKVNSPPCSPLKTRWRHEFDRTLATMEYINSIAPRIGCTSTDTVPTEKGEGEPFNCSCAVLTEKLVEHHGSLHGLTF